MHRKPALITLVTAVENSCQQLDAQRSAAPSVLVPLLQQRRRMYAMLRAMLRWHGLETPAPQTRVVLGPSHPQDLVDAERQLLALYDDALAQAGQDAPELRLLSEQRSETERAFRAISGLLRQDSGISHPDAAHHPSRRQHASGMHR